MKAELKAKAEHYLANSIEGTVEWHIVNDLSTALQEAEAQIKAMRETQGLTERTLQQQLQVAVEALSKISATIDVLGDDTMRGVAIKGWSKDALTKIKEMEGSDE